MFVSVMIEIRNMEGWPIVEVGGTVDRIPLILPKN